MSLCSSKKLGAVFENDWMSNIDGLMFCLRSLSVRNNFGKVINSDVAFIQLHKITQNIRKRKNRIYFIGNGASASIASHISADLAKNAYIHTEVFTDISLMTALANDLSYEEVFSEPLRHRMTKGDMLVIISSSGNSPNVLRGAKTAKELGGTVITLSAIKEDNRLRQMGDLNFYVSAQTYALAETSHAAILHFWVDQVIKE